MKIFEVISRAGESGETILGAEDTGSHACYLSGEETLFLENLIDQPAVYLLAGGHSDSGHH